MGCLTVSAFLFCAEARAATLADSVTEALATHPAIEAGNAAGDVADNALWEQKSAFFPTLSLHANAGREHANNNTTRGLAGLDGATSWVTAGGATLSQPLFSGFSTLNRVRAAEDKLEAAQYDLGGTSESMALRAARAHLNLMRTKELLGIAGSYYKEILSRHGKIGLMVKSGAADDGEALQADALLLSARTTRLGYDEAWRQAEADYIDAVGHQQDSQLDLGPSSWDALVPGTLDEAVHATRAESPQIKSADKMAAAFGRESEAAQGDLVPKLSADISYDRKNQRDPMGGNSEDVSALVRATWDISTGGGDVARLRRGKAERVQAQARRNEAVRTAEREVRKKFTSMQVVDEQFGLLVSREEAQEKILGSALKQFEAGKQSNLQLIALHAKLFDARAARIDAHYRTLLSRFELLSVIGRLRQAFGPTEKKAEASAPVPHVVRD